MNEKLVLNEITPDDVEDGEMYLLFYEAKKRKEFPIPSNFVPGMLDEGEWVIAWATDGYWEFSNAPILGQGQGERIFEHPTLQKIVKNEE